MVSFSSEVKEELCRDVPTKKCCAVSVCYGVLLFCNTFASHEIKIITGNPHFAKYLPKLFRRAFGISFDRISDNNGKNGKQIFVIDDKDKISAIFETFGYSTSNFVSHHVNLGVLEDSCCKRSFIRGAFMAGGSITDPKKRYHFELVTSHYSVSRETYSLLLELGYEPGETTRKGTYVVYFKQSEVIEDLLTMLGASISSMKVMSAKIEKGMTNSVNRQVNCDTANVNKMVEASRQQIAAISKIDKEIGLSTLPEKLCETANMRLKNPDLSIAELAESFYPPVTKSCLNHRLRKLMQMAGNE